MTQKQQKDDLIVGLEQAERARRRKTMLVGAIIAFAAAAAFALSFTFREELFQPKIDIESGEEEVIELTNDPQCREFIAKITAAGMSYRSLEPDLQSQLLGDDVSTIEERVEDLEALKERVAAARELSAEANLRFDHSREEVNDWFAYVDNEFTLLQNVGREQITALQPADVPDAGTLVEDPNKPTSEKTPQERLDGATLAANEAFEKFRVWHTGGLHPCGAADEGETPWQPEAKK